MATQTVSYEPPRGELNYYEDLFNAADTAKTGEINGRDAVNFLSRSKLPVDLLRNIWNMADQSPKTNSLDKRKFFTSVRLIQLFQNGQKAQGPNLMCADANFVMRPPFFDFAVAAPSQGGGGGAQANASVALSAGSPPPPAPLLTSAPTSPDGLRRSQLSTSSQQGLISSPEQQPKQPMPPAPVPSARALTQDPYLMLPGEQVRYESHFPQYEKDGFVYGKEAVDLFSKSGLAKEVLRDIWNLVDNPVDNRLSRLEFAIAMHLIVCISKKNLPLPPVLPPSLLALKAKAGNAASASVPAGQDPGPEQGQMTLPSPTTSLQPVQAPQMAGPPSLPSGAPALRSSLNGGSKMNVGMLQPSAISDAFEGMHKRSPSADSVRTPPLNNTTGSRTRPGSSSQEELEKVRSVLQRLQAENISLKAQLGQFSDEEKQVRDETARTVHEIGNLSQELTSLRSQVVNAKSSLIEASAELKAQLEKRDLLKTLISETDAMRDAFQTGLQTIHDAEEIAKVTKRNGSSHVESSAAVATANPFGDAGSVLTDAFADSSSYQHGVSQVQREQLPSQGAPASYYEQPIPAPAPPQQTGPSEESLQQLEGLRIEAEKAEQDGTSADDHAKALELQFEDIRAEAERANATANERQNAKSKKKKGLRRGGKDKKEQKKELESALQYSSQKNDEANRAHFDLQNAKANASKLMAEGRQKRARADAYEMKLTEEVTTVYPPIPAPLSREEFGAAARGQNSVERQTHNPYDTNQTPYKDSNTPYANLMGQPSNDSNVMGFGGYPGTPAAPGMFDSVPMGGTLMGGSVGSNPAAFTENLMGGSATNPTDSSIIGGMSHAGSVSYVGAPSITSERDGNPTNDGMSHSMMNSAFPTDSSFADMSDTGVSYESARQGAEMSYVGTNNSAFPADSSVAGVSYASASIAGAQNPAFPAESSVTGAGISYTSANNAGVQNTAFLAESSATGVSNAGLSYEYTSGNNAGVQNTAFLAESSATGVSNAGLSYEYTSGNNAGVQNSAFLAESSATGVSNAGLSYEYTSGNNAGVQNSAFLAESSVAGVSFTSAPRSVNETSIAGVSYEPAGVPNQGSIDTFEHNGPSQFDENVGLKNLNVTPSQSFEAGILAPAPSSDSAYNSMSPAENDVGTTGVLDQPLNNGGFVETTGKDSFGAEAFDGIPSPNKNAMLAGNNPPTSGMATLSMGPSVSQEMTMSSMGPSASHDMTMSSLGPSASHDMTVSSLGPSASHDTTISSMGPSASQEIEGTSVVNGKFQNNVADQFGGQKDFIPAASNLPAMGMTGFGAAPSESLSDGIPSPSGSIEYANPFAS